MTRIRPVGLVGNATKRLRNCMIVLFTFSQNGPCIASYFTCQRNRCRIEVASGFFRRYPATALIGFIVCIFHYGSCSVDQKPSYITITSLAYSLQYDLIATGALFGDQTDEGSQVAAVLLYDVRIGYLVALVSSVVRTLSLGVLLPLLWLRHPWHHFYLT